jgi:hypothetical protein
VFLNFSWYIAVTLFGMFFAKIMFGGVVVAVAKNSSRVLFVNDKKYADCRWDLSEATVVIVGLPIS